MYTPRVWCTLGLVVSFRFSDSGSQMRSFSGESGNRETGNSVIFAGMRFAGPSIYSLRCHVQHPRTLMLLTNSYVGTFENKMLIDRNLQRVGRWAQDGAAQVQKK